MYMEIFEEQEIQSAPSKPKIWKCYVDDTFTILDRDIILQHLNIHKPTIRFTIETENDSQSQENQMAALRPASTGNQLTLINT